MHVCEVEHDESFNNVTSKPSAYLDLENVAVAIH